MLLGILSLTLLSLSKGEGRYCSIPANFRAIISPSMLLGILSLTLLSLSKGEGRYCSVSANFRAIISPSMLLGILSLTLLSLSKGEGRYCSVSANFRAIISPSMLLGILSLTLLSLSLLLRQSADRNDEERDDASVLLQSSELLHQLQFFSAFCIFLFHCVVKKPELLDRSAIGKLLIHQLDITNLHRLFERCYLFVIILLIGNELLCDIVFEPGLKYRFHDCRVIQFLGLIDDMPPRYTAGMVMSYIIFVVFYCTYDVTLVDLHVVDIIQ